MGRNVNLNLTADLATAQQNAKENIKEATLYLNEMFWLVPSSISRIKPTPVGQERKNEYRIRFAGKRESDNANYGESEIGSCFINCKDIDAVIGWLPELASATIDSLETLVSGAGKALKLTSAEKTVNPRKQKRFVMVATNVALSNNGPLYGFETADKIADVTAKKVGDLQYTPKGKNKGFGVTEDNELIVRTAEIVSIQSLASQLAQHFTGDGWDSVVRTGVQSVRKVTDLDEVKAMMVEALPSVDVEAINEANSEELAEEPIVTAL